MWSPWSGLNWWPRPYQGRALPTELHGRIKIISPTPIHKTTKKPVPLIFFYRKSKGQLALCLYYGSANQGKLWNSTPPVNRYFIFLQRRFLGKTPHAQCQLSIKSGKASLALFRIFRPAGFGFSSIRGLTLISRQSLHAEDGLRMDAFTFGIWEYVLCKKDSWKALSKAQAVSVNFHLILSLTIVFSPPGLRLVSSKTEKNWILRRLLQPPPILRAFSLWFLKFGW